MVYIVIFKFNKIDYIAHIITLPATAIDDSAYINDSELNKFDA